jgi:hypothetical protein
MSNYYIGSGAITDEDVNIQVTISAFSTAPG